MSKTALIVAYHFPPLSGSSGIQRSLRFVQYLREYGWNPVVVSAHPRLYERTSEDLLKDVPSDVPVERLFGFDTGRDLAIKGRYWSALAMPDRYRTWAMNIAWQAKRIVQKYQPDVVWSTYPIASAHLAGVALAKAANKPWVADFRDLMAQPGYPSDPKQRQAYLKIEAEVFRSAQAAVFTTHGAVRYYRDAYGDAIKSALLVIENGYDESTFSGLTRQESRPANAPLLFLHSGVIYREERDPTQFFEALGRLKNTLRLSPKDCLFRFRAAHQDALLSQLAKEHGVSELIEILPPVDYQTALNEMMSADCLMLMQASNCNDQIPAKAYEYLRSARPILAFTDPVGDTADLMRRSGSPLICPLNDAAAIAATIDKTLALLRAQTAPVASSEVVAQFSRRAQTGHLAALFDQLVAR